MIIYKNPKHAAIAKKINEILSAEDVPESTIEEFTTWFIKNESAWEAFKKKAYRAMSKGISIGAKCVAENVRYLIEVKRNGQFKINNNYISYMARIFNQKYKKKYFDTKIVRGLKEAA